MSAVFGGAHAMSGWLAETLVATTLLMVLVLVLRPLVRRAFGASAAYALWAVPALRLFLPPLHVESLPLPAAAAQPVEIVFAATGHVGGAGMWLIAVWALGALAFASWHVAHYRRFLKRALAAGTLNSSYGASVVLTDAVAGPAAVGLFRPRILVPRDFPERFDAAESELALRHERVHHSRGDLWANAAALGMLSLHWFNPVAHRAYRAFREDQELSCDAAVIAVASLEERAAYGAALVKSAQGIGWSTPAAPSTICPMTRNHNLKRRLKMVRTHRKSALASTGGAVAVGMTALAGLTLTATSGIAAERVQTIRKITVKQVDGPKGLADALGKELDSKCGNVQDRFETTAESQQNGTPVKTMFVLCNKAGAAPTDRMKMMEGARAAIAGKTDIDAEKRAKILAALDSAIAKLKAGQ